MKRINLGFADGNYYVDAANSTGEYVDAETFDELLEAAVDAFDYLSNTIGLSCEEGCDCLIHPLGAAIAKARGES